MLQVSVILTNCGVWILAITIGRLVVPAVENAIVPFAVSFSALLVGLMTASKWRINKYTFISTILMSIAATLVILFFYAKLFNFRLGMNVGGIGTEYDVIVVFGSIYISILLIINLVLLFSRRV